MADSSPFPRWAYAVALEEVRKAPTLEALDQVVARCWTLAADQGRLELDAAIRRRRLELAIAGGEAVWIADHARAVMQARADELRRVLEELRAMAAQIEGEARLARDRGRHLEAAGKDEHARLLKRAARRIGGR